MVHLYSQKSSLISKDNLSIHSAEITPERWCRQVSQLSMSWTLLLVVRRFPFSLLMVYLIMILVHRFADRLLSSNKRMYMITQMTTSLSCSLLWVCQMLTLVSSRLISKFTDLWIESSFSWTWLMTRQLKELLHQDLLLPPLSISPISKRCTYLLSWLICHMLMPWEKSQPLVKKCPDVWFPRLHVHRFVHHLWACRSCPRI